MNPSNESIPDFHDKAVTFYLVNLPLEHAITLDSPTFELQANRLFVVGSRVPTSSQDWTSGIRMCVAWDQVSTYMVFESAEDFKKRIGASPGGFFGLFGSRAT